MIRIKNLSFGYSKELIIEDMSVVIDRGEYVLIKGNNGSGKSTLINCLLGYNKVVSGMITIGGVDINDFKSFKKIGYVRQTHTSKIDVPITAMEYYNLICKDKGKIDEVIEMLDIKSFVNIDVNTLSGGQRQRINIGKSLLHEVEYLILDEPVTGLDFDSRKGLYDLLRRLNDKAITIIIVSHHLEEITCKIDKIYDMDNHILEECDVHGCVFC